MDIKNISIDFPLVPYIELDGGYAMCFRCGNEVTPMQNKCSKCHQLQDWSWFNKDN